MFNLPTSDPQQLLYLLSAGVITYLYGEVVVLKKRLNRLRQRELDLISKLYALFSLVDEDDSPKKTEEANKIRTEIETILKDAKEN